ncbi:MAG: hypothetical protein JWN70_3235 [Planctomycetaceae bacterium]|nr:hypothetical protein [Planctomycetaceae bacterium]
MFQFSLILAGLMILTAQVPYLMRPRWMPVVAFLVWGSLWFFVMLVIDQLRYPPAVGWLFWMLVLAVPIARLAKLHWGWFQAICLCCTLVAYGISMYEFMPAYREHQALLAEYPVTELKPRLSYEQKTAPSMAPDSKSVADVFGSANAERPRHSVYQLKELEQSFRKYLDMENFRAEYRKNDRRLAFKGLAQVHAGFVADFIAQPGVGRSRIPGLKLLRKGHLNEVWEGIHLDALPELIDQPDPQSPALDSPGNAPLEDQAVGKNLVAADNGARIQSDRAQERQNLQSFHHDSITNFVPLNSLGGVNDRLEAWGFQSHAFRLAPEKMDTRIEATGWMLARLELVSLLKHQPPAVYVSEHLPAMDELRDAPTRAVTRFESDALAKLVAGEELILDKPDNHELRMLGSIRAIAACRECHQVPLGGLLGAFTYKFTLETFRRPTTDKKVATRE